MKVLTLFRHKRTLYIAGSVLLLAIAFTIGYRYWMAPTRIPIVNPLPAQAADIVLNNDSRNIEVTCIQTENLESFKGYDAVVLYGRSLNLERSTNEGGGTCRIDRYSTFHDFTA